MAAGQWVPALHHVLAAADVTPLKVGGDSGAATDPYAFVEAMYHEHAAGLVRMARLFVDDRNAAEDLVQEAYIRLARSSNRIREPRFSAAWSQHFRPGERSRFRSGRRRIRR